MNRWSFKFINNWHWNTGCHFSFWNFEVSFFPAKTYVGYFRGELMFLGLGIAVTYDRRFDDWSEDEDIWPAEDNTTPDEHWDDL